MIPTLITFLTRLFALIWGLARFLRVPRTLPTPAEAAPAPPAAAPSALSEIEAQLDAQIAEFDQWEREYNREQRAYRKLLREQARARGQFPPPKPRKPRQSKPSALPQALPNTPPAVTAKPNPNPLPQPHIQARPAAPPAAPPAIPSLSTPSRPTPSQVTPPRTLFAALSKILTAPLRLLKTALLALPRLFFRRRPPSDGPPAARPTAPTLQNRAA